jgi:UDPglucose--hexose-1-phosphate uridylyltransferase
MSTLRKDPISNGWVIISEERAARPQDFASEKAPPRGPGSCPFCGGNETKTPPEICAVREEGTEPDTPGWSVRTIPNKFAALHIEGELDRRGEGIYDLMNGVGAHEVIVETPEHDGHMAYYPREKTEEVIWMYIQRYRDLLKDKRFRYIQIFRNYGPVAGASLEHPHSQLIALPITPRWVKEELTSALAYYRLKERCLFCDIVQQEIRDRQRVVFENESFVTIEPFASKFPFETWLFPKEHNHDFSQTTKQQVTDLAEALQRTLFAIAGCLNDPPLNFIIHSAPRVTEYDLLVSDIRVDMDYHWHIEIFPRVTRMAGFEWGTGFYINPMVPERAAEELRRVFDAYSSQIRRRGPQFAQPGNEKRIH